MVGGRSAGGPIAGLAQLGLASALVVSHFTTTSPFVYPHYVVIILFHPLILRLVGIFIEPWQRVYIAIALFLHPMGGLYGFYHTIWYYDHVTHFMSATLVSSIGYVLARSRWGDTATGRWLVPAFTMVFILTAGFVWEVIEILTPVLTVYGPNDTAWDYVFNTMGGLTIIAVGRFVLAEAAEDMETPVDLWGVQTQAAD